MNEITIRSLVESDIDDAVAILIGGAMSPEAESPDNPSIYRDALEQCRVNGGDVLVAELNGEVVGVCQVIIFRHFQRSGGLCAELESVHVRGDLRSMGIGAKLLQAAEDLARSLGCYRVQLTSNAVRNDAHRFYETHGYHATHRGFKKILTGS